MKIKRTERTGRSGLAHEWIFGLNPVIEAIKAGRSIKNILISAGRHDSPRVLEIKKEAEKKNVSIIRTDISYFHSHFPKGHQGIAAEVLPKSYMDLEELLEIPSNRGETPFFILLDCIEDPRNFGAILRIADAAGVHGIVIQSRRAATLGSEVAKSSAGAVEYVHVSMVPNIKHAIWGMKERGITVVGAEIGVEKFIWDLDLRIPIALVIGSEGKGLRKTVKENCDLLVSIPMKGRIKSLNVSIAVGVVVFEIFHQRLHEK